MSDALYHYDNDKEFNSVLDKVINEYFPDGDKPLNNSFNVDNYKADQYTVEENDRWVANFPENNIPHYYKPLVYTVGKPQPVNIYKETDLEGLVGLYCKQIN